MFGYIRVRHPELRVLEYEAYRGAYCGLCRSMGKCTGQCSRMTLSYDFVFMAAVRLCLTNEPVVFKARRCLAHPTKKRSVMQANGQLDACSYAAAILGYYKVMDDLSDERGAKKLRAIVTKPFFAHARRRAQKAGYGTLDNRVRNSLAELSTIERGGAVSVDAPASIFGEIVADIISYGLDGNACLIARQIGMAVGKWIYIIDALDDMDEDIMKGRYNPIVSLYGGRLPTDAELTDIADAMKLELCAAEAAMDLMDTENSVMRSIIENILYLGMPDAVSKVINGNGTQRKDIQERKES